MEMTKLEKEYIKLPLENDIYKTNIKGKYSTLKVYRLQKMVYIYIINKFSLDNTKGLERN